MANPFRWETRALSNDPFEGDFGDPGDAILSDKFVTNRKGGTCHNCASPCSPGTRNRVIAGVYDQEFMRFRWCQACSFAMAVYDIRPSIYDVRTELGDERRRVAELATPKPD